MENIWTIRVWGVRGSFPIPDAHFLTYGGNTSCISAECGEQLVVFDAGSGLVQLGETLCKKKNNSIHILLSHFHIDHIMGLFRFKPLYDQNAKIHLYGEFQESGSFDPLRSLIGPPYWPIGLHDHAAHIALHPVKPGEHFFLSGQAEDPEALRIYTMRGNHPGQSIFYRLESGETSITYALDCEMNENMFHSMTEFSRNSSLIIWDANFTKEDLAKHPGWGHSSWNEGLNLCRAADIKKILMTHYSPDYPDEFIKNEEIKAARLSNACNACCFAKEGMIIHL